MHAFRLGSGWNLFFYDRRYFGLIGGDDDTRTPATGWLWNNTGGIRLQTGGLLHAGCFWCLGYRGIQSELNDFS